MPIVFAEAHRISTIAPAHRGIVIGVHAKGKPCVFFPEHLGIYELALTEARERLPDVTSAHEYFVHVAARCFLLFMHPR
jgi:hypothetical protein